MKHKDSVFILSLSPPEHYNRCSSRVAKWISLFLIFHFQLYSSHPFCVSSEFLIIPFPSFSAAEFIGGCKTSSVSHPAMTCLSQCTALSSNVPTLVYLYGKQNKTNPNKPCFWIHPDIFSPKLVTNRYQDSMSPLTYSSEYSSWRLIMCLVNRFTEYWSKDTHRGNKVFRDIAVLSSKKRVKP